MSARLTEQQSHDENYYPMIVIKKQIKLWVFTQPFTTNKLLINSTVETRHKLHVLITKSFSLVLKSIDVTCKFFLCVTLRLEEAGVDVLFRVS